MSDLGLQTGEQCLQLVAARFKRFLHCLLVEQIDAPEDQRTEESHYGDQQHCADARIAELPGDPNQKRDHAGNEWQQVPPEDVLQHPDLVIDLNQRGQNARLQEIVADGAS